MITFEGVEKAFPDGKGGVTHAVRGLDLVIERGETHCLLGPSGCGKTTTLRLVNRLEEPTGGRLEVDGKDVRAHDVIALRRGIGYVIQRGGLFPHLTVARNVGLLGVLEGWSSANVQARVHELLELVRLPPGTYAHRDPAALSGGQRQRVGLARALFLDPPIILLDEPFGALDPLTRVELWGEFKELAKRLEKTVLLVTHDLREAFELGDRITLMHDGCVVQTGRQADFRERPASPFVASFFAAHGVAGGAA